MKKINNSPKDAPLTSCGLTTCSWIRCQRWHCINGQFNYCCCHCQCQPRKHSFGGYCGFSCRCWFFTVIFSNVWVACCLSRRSFDFYWCS